MSPPCQFLEWDSRFFGLRIARVSEHALTEDRLRGVLAWCEAESIDCLYFLATCDDDATVRLAERCGFHLVDIRLTLALDVPGSAREQDEGKSLTLRFQEPDDLQALQVLAGTSFRGSRFYMDGHFPRERCDALYRTWVERAFQAENERVLVAAMGSTVAGFVTVERHPDGHGQIGLLAVAPSFRGQGVGSALVRRARDWFVEQGLRQATVVTQGRNVAAQRAYLREGFVTSAVQLWYHRWQDSSRR